MFYRFADQTLKNSVHPHGVLQLCFGCDCKGMTASIKVWVITVCFIGGGLLCVDELGLKRKAVCYGEAVGEYGEGVGEAACVER